mmetsp:Transcript_30392/g.46616  ORF Transcript_30392/g.46616 Transcript_30392/m.46616 type:complete len:210 (+) Transcript_30392:552-1181(+)
MSGIFNNGNDICPCLGHINQVTSWTMRKFHRIDRPLGTNNVRYMGHGCSRSGTHVQYFGSWFDPNIIDTTQYSGSNLGTEWIPYTIFDLGCISIGSWWTFDGNSFFTIDSHSRCGVECDEGIFLPTCDKDTFVSVRLDDYLGTTLHTTTTSSSTSTTASSSTSTSSSSTASSSASAITSTKSTSSTSSTSTTSSSSKTTTSTTSSTSTG